VKSSCTGRAKAAYVAPLNSYIVFIIALNVIVK